MAEVEWGAEETAPSLVCLSCKHRDLRLNLPYQ